MSAIDAILSNFVVTEEKWGEARKELAQLRTSNTRMADVVSAEVLWIKEFDNDVILFVRQGSCDCAYCTLIRAVDKYARSE
jgi:hypothetical protein